MPQKTNVPEQLRPDPDVERIAGIYIRHGCEIAGEALSDLCVVRRLKLWEAVSLAGYVEQEVRRRGGHISSPSLSKMH